MGRLENITGKTFNRLTVISPAERRNDKAHWYCKCSCGNSHVVENYKLKSGHTKSCGCHKLEELSKHPHGTTHGQYNSVENRAWSSMHNRCRNETSTAYPGYGGRGITVCERWAKFTNFISDMGPRPAGHTLERIDNDKGYSPDNCKWATRKQQQNNRRNTVYITFEGVTMPRQYWAELYHLKEHTLYARIVVLGWSVERALKTPLKKPLLTVTV